VIQPAALPENAQRAFSPLETKRQEPRSRAAFPCGDHAESETRISGRTPDPTRPRGIRDQGVQALSRRRAAKPR
jgi:hypothetical protein